MGFLRKFKHRRVRGAELVVTGGVTLFLSYAFYWLAPGMICVYGVYRWLVKKSYRDGIISLAAGILLIILLNGPFGFVLSLLKGTGIFLIVIGAILMLSPSRKPKEVTTK
jgi:branched-subunit amino acid transport protein AzlD